MKLPQVFKLIGSGSAEGLSFLGVFLEVLAVTLNAGYSYNNGFPFSAYGESIFLSIQVTWSYVDCESGIITKRSAGCRFLPPFCGLYVHCDTRNILRLLVIFKF